MSVTLEELYVRVADRIEVTEANEPLAAEDRQKIADTYPGVWAMLEGRGLVRWGPDEDIPDRYWLMVRDLLAEQVARDFQSDFTAPWALPELTRQTKPDYTYDETRFFDF